MFLHAAHSGRREVEWMVHWAHQHGLLHLDLQADISAVQSVGPHISREEIRNLHYQVYKLRRLPGSPPHRLEWTDELTNDVVSSLKNYLRQKEDELPREQRRSEFVDTHQHKAEPHGGKAFGSNWAWLGKEAHQRALATMMALEEKFERLSWSITRDWLNIHTPSRSWDWQRKRSQGQSRRQCRSFPMGRPAHSPANRRVRRPNHLPWSLTWGPHQSWTLTWNASFRTWLASVGKIRVTIFLQNPCG